MTIPLMALLLFTLWTVIILFITIGVYRWKRILTGQVDISACTHDNDFKDEWYQRAQRVHANCLENLPIFTVIVFWISYLDIHNALVNWLAILVVVFRILQSLIHLTFKQTNLIASLRFSLFLAQILCMGGMAYIAALMTDWSF